MKKNRKSIFISKMETFNLVCISLFLLEYSTINFIPPVFWYREILFLHIFCQHLYVWIIVFSSFLEFLFYFLNWNKYYLFFVPWLDEYVVGTLLNSIVFSGIYISKIKYRHTIPEHIQTVITSLKKLGLFWFLLDKTTQKITFFDTFYIRSILNLFSCYQLFQIQATMRRRR